MRTPKLAVASAAVLIALAGCGQTNASGGGDQPGAAATSAAADPTERVNAAGRKLSDSSFKFTIESAGMTGGGVRHKPSNSMSMKFAAEAEGQKVNIEMVQIDKDMYMKLDLGDLGDDPAAKEMAAALGGWQHVSQDDAESQGMGALAKTGADAIGTDMIKGSSNIKETSPGTFTGTLDLSKTTDLDFTDEGSVEALGDKAKAVPVTFTLDDADRLTSIVIEVPAAGSIKAQKMTVKFADFDKVAQPKAPPADQIKER